MNNDLTIEARGLGKAYRLGSQKRRTRSLRESLSMGARRLLHRAAPPAPPEEFWALQDLSFEVRRGEVVGVVGRNGSGKSTLLKILSRITPPSRGHARIVGRVGALLEVGTGFHPDLTGLENIFLSAAVMGMSRRETRSKLDEIVDFADVAGFLETPVKHYSSGMHMRLAFSVAAHLELEILLVDEVLAVGDSTFQQKCLGKMEAVSASGRTVIFVSHSAEAVARLCSKALLLEKGSLKKFAPTAEVLADYLHGAAQRGCSRRFDAASAPGNRWVRLDAVSAQTAHATDGVFDGHDPIQLTVDYSVRESVRNLATEVSVFNQEGVLLFSSIDARDAATQQRAAGRYSSRCTIVGNLLGEGIFFVRIALLSLHTPPQIHVQEDDAIVFHVIDTSPLTAVPRRPGLASKAMIRPRLAWQTDYVGQ